MSVSLKNYYAFPFKKLSLILSLAITLSMASAQVSLQTSLDSTRIEIGTPFTLRVKLSFDPSISPPLPDLSPLEINEKDLEVLGVKAWDTLVAEHATYISTEVQLAVYDTGTVMIPVLNLIYKDGKQRDTVSSENLFIRILPPAQMQEDILPIKDLERIPESKMHYLYIALAIIAFLLIAWFTWKAYKRKKVAETPAEAPVIILTPKERALQAIQSLLEPDAGDQTAVKLFYSSITHILKTFIQEEHQFQALDQTSEAFLNWLREKFGQVIFQTMKYFFEAADMIKFAKADAESDMIRQAKGIATDFIHQTAVKKETDKI
jgi:hypothetical protein